MNNWSFKYFNDLYEIFTRMKYPILAIFVFLSIFSGSLILLDFGTWILALVKI